MHEINEVTSSSHLHAGHLFVALRSENLTVFRLISARMYLIVLGLARSRSRERYSEVSCATLIFNLQLRFVGFVGNCEFGHLAPNLLAVRELVLSAALLCQAFQIRYSATILATYLVIVQFRC